MWVLFLCGSGGSQGQTGERAAAKQLNSLRHSIPDHPNPHLIIIMYLFDTNSKTILTTTSTCKKIKLFTTQHPGPSQPASHSHQNISCLHVFMTQAHICVFKQVQTLYNTASLTIPTQLASHHHQNISCLHVLMTQAHMCI